MAKKYRTNFSNTSIIHAYDAQWKIKEGQVHPPQNVPPLSKKQSSFLHETTYVYRNEVLGGRQYEILIFLISIY